MDFGRLPEQELKNVDFVLPPDPVLNGKVLKGKKAKKPAVFIGCAKWGRKEWIGKIYPKGTKEAGFLDEYVKHYNSIELNATHYKLYKPEDIKKWAARAGDASFKFCPKVYNGISHFGSLSEKKFLTDAFLESVTAFEDKLGPVFLQVSDKFSPKRKDDLFQYLQTLPKDLQFFLEVRHPDWFKREESSELFSFLNQAGIGAVITDTAGRRDCCHMHLSLPRTFIRFVGNSLHPSDYTRIDDWVERIAAWLDEGLQELYFFMHMHDEAYSPELTVYLVEKLNKTCGLDLMMPKFVEKGQGELF
ncbi:MAG TPA: DUF72 domain-containing protein [Flavisolibacter sp.]|nr:DUF72 domain-containing protein [Flavisolibacter sp.]